MWALRELLSSVNGKCFGFSAVDSVSSCVRKVGRNFFSATIDIGVLRNHESRLYPEKSASVLCYGNYYMQDKFGMEVY